MSKELDDIRGHIIENIVALEKKIKYYWKPEDVTLYKSIHLSELSTYKRLLNFKGLDRRNPRYRREED